jgi:hypothetical protein
MSGTRRSQIASQGRARRDAAAQVPERRDLGEQYWHSVCVSEPPRVPWARLMRWVKCNAGDARDDARGGGVSGGWRWFKRWIRGETRQRQVPDRRVQSCRSRCELTSGRSTRVGVLRSHEPTVRCPITRARLIVRARHLPPAWGSGDLCAPSVCRYHPLWQNRSHGASSSGAGRLRTTSKSLLSISTKRSLRRAQNDAVLSGPHAQTGVNTRSTPAVVSDSRSREWPGDERARPCAHD